MNRELHQRAQDLFLSAADLPQEKWSDYLDQECVDSPELRRTVEGMLRVERDEGEFLDRSPFGAVSASQTQRTRIQKLVEQSNAGGRLLVEEEIACGGMGTIFRVRDTDMRRTLAMKVIRGQKGASSTGDVPGVPQELVDRFLGEAVVTGQLDHPGVVPVYETRRRFFGTAILHDATDRGRTLAEVIELVHEDSSSWSRTRALAVIQKICETMAFAHDAGVIHRDLKPANVMVGEYGEVYVMDWGLARMRGQEASDHNSPDIDPPTQTHHRWKTPKQTRLEATRCLEEDSAFVTRQGAIIGTPFYMSPEQARGEGDRVGAAADIYAVGALLYHLFAGAAPYTNPKQKIESDQVLADLRRGPPPPIQDLSQGLSAELASICEKAMARESEDRYDDMASLASDLQAYLEGRVVRAHRTGAWVELRKWITRNRFVASAARSPSSRFCSVRSEWHRRRRIRRRLRKSRRATRGRWRRRIARRRISLASRSGSRPRFSSSSSRRRRLHSGLPSRARSRAWTSGSRIVERVLPLVDGATRALSGTSEVRAARARANARREGTDRDAPHRSTGTPRSSTPYPPDQHRR